jgi:hypothetical protein
MKTMIKLIILGATVVMFALPAVAATRFEGSEVQDQCTQENKDAYYEAFRASRTADQAKAYESAKKYLACPPGEVTEATQKIIDYLKRWVGLYDEGTQKNKLPQLLYTDKNYKEAYKLGAELLTKEPENLTYLIHLGANGYLIAPLKDPTLSNTALSSAKKAITLLESGKTIDDWKPLAGKDSALAYLNYTVGVFNLETDPSAALKSLIASAQFETPLKSYAQTYGYIGAAYEAGPYAKQSEAYKVYAGKDETPESKLALANINQIVDRMIDAYARAVALSTDPKLAAQKAAWMESLTDWYKYRHNKETTGLNEMVASVLSKPLPPEPTPLTSLPTPTTPATTPIGNSGTASTSAATQPANGTKPATAKTGTPDKPKNK